MHTDDGTILDALARAGKDFRENTHVLKQTAACGVRKLLSPNLLGDLARLDLWRSRWAIRRR